MLCRSGKSIPQKGHGMGKKRIPEALPRAVMRLFKGTKTKMKA